MVIFKCMESILQINSVYKRGSTGSIVDGLSMSMEQSGSKSHVVFGRGKHTSKSRNVVRVGSGLSVLKHVLMTRLFDAHGLYSTWATYKLIRYIKKTQPALIHLHNIHGYYLNYIQLFKFLRKANIPVVWTFHDCWPMTGHCAHFTYVRCDKWRQVCSNCAQKRTYPASWLLDQSTRNFQRKMRAFLSVHDLTIVVVSDWLGTVVKGSFLKNIDVKRIYNGVDLSVFRPKESRQIIRIRYGLQAEIILTAVSSEWNARKGYSDYLELRKILPANMVMIMVGMEENDIVKLPAGMVGIPKVKQDDLVDLYSASDVVLNLSYEESFGLTTVEGLACGIPGIVYDQTASPELIDELTGRVVVAGDIKAVKASIYDLLEVDKEIMTKNCRERVFRLFNKDDRYKEYIDLYSEKIQQAKFK